MVLYVHDLQIHPMTNKMLQIADLWLTMLTSNGLRTQEYSAPWDVVPKKNT